MDSRLLWFLVYVCSLCWVSFNVSCMYMNRKYKPISSTQEAEYFPTNELTFPGVAICSINRISLRSATKLATEMFEAGITDLSVEDILKEISKLGELYSSQFERTYNYTLLTLLLSRFYNDTYDVNDVLKELTPKCASILMDCYFHGEKLNCMDVIRMGKTRDGYCCTFNYVLQDEDTPPFKEESKRTIYSVGTVGVHYGLSLVMDPMLDDYFYSVLPMVGWKVLIFDPYDYPDPRSGSVSEVLVAPLSEKFIEVKAVGLYSTSIVRSYSLQQRGCIFADEEKSNYTAYTQSDCITVCKLRHIWKKCNCRPFFYLRQVNMEGFKRTCSMEDMPCLMEYYEKSYEIVPYEDSIVMSLIENKRTSIICKNCYPECNDMTYLVQSSVINIRPGFVETNFAPSTNVTNHSMVHVFFSDIGSTFLRQDQVDRWYEQFSYIGGLYGLFVGFSIVSLVEIIYFILLFIHEIRTPIKPVKNKNSRKELNYPAYWTEFLPQHELSK